MIAKKSDHGRVMNSIGSELMASARARFNSAISPSTTPRIIGASGKPYWRIVKPSRPKKNSVQMSSTELCKAKTPMVAKVRMIVAST